MSPALLSLVLVLSAGGSTPHPAVANDSPDACQTCHAEATPEIVRQWESGRHGLLLVKCFVCHGSTGKDFARRPDPRRCDGCHAGKLAALPAKRAPRAKVADCFSCHAPHTLAAAPRQPDPHPAH